MKDIIFKRTELEDKEIMTKYFDEHPSRSCERTFVNVFLWSRQYPVKWAIVEGAMVFKSEDEGHVAYAFPAGTDEHVKRALDKMKTYSEERGYPFRMFLHDWKAGIREDSRLSMTGTKRIMSMKARS